MEKGKQLNASKRLGYARDWLAVLTKDQKECPIIMPEVFFTTPLSQNEPVKVYIDNQAMFMLDVNPHGTVKFDRHLKMDLILQLLPML